MTEEDYKAIIDQLLQEIQRLTLEKAVARKDVLALNQQIEKLKEERNEAAVSNQQAEKIIRP